MTDNKPRRQTRRTFAAVTLVFCLLMVMIAFFVGKADNPLHVNIVDWSFWTVWIVFGGYVLDANINRLLELKKTTF